MLNLFTKRLTHLIKPVIKQHQLHQFHKSTYLLNSTKMSGQNLNEIIEKLNDFAPESLAEKWDNVGLLIEPYTVK